MELFEEIRRGYAAGETVKGLAKKHGVHRRMVRHCVTCSIPQFSAAIYPVGKISDRSFWGTRLLEYPGEVIILCVR